MRRVRSGIIAVLVSGVLAGSCGEEPAPGAGSAGEAAARGAGGQAVDDEGAEGGPVDAQAQAREVAARYEAFVAAYAEALRATLIERVGEGDLRERLAKRLDAGIAHDLQRREMRASERPVVDLFYAETMKGYYEPAGFAPLFTRGGRLTEAAGAIFALLGDVESHALSREDYRYAQLEGLIEQTQEVAERLGSWPGLGLYEAEQEALAAYLELEGFDVAAPDAAAQLTARLLRADEANPLPRLAWGYELYEAQHRRLLALSVELEVKFADSYVRYARDMRHGNLNRFSEAERAAYELGLGDELHPRKHSEVVVARLIGELATVAGLTSAEGARAHVASLWPSHEQYRKLREQLARYRRLVAEGGWEVVPDGRLNHGGRAPRVTQLKRRLAVEGYYDGPIDDLFDARLIEAVRLYQETHQMEVTGQVDSPVFWRSLNTPAHERMAQIEVNLDRWRRSRIAPSEHYVYINIPDFHAEVWRGGERTMRFRIVVGSSRRRCSASTRRVEFVNATPLQHAKLHYVIFNPYWNVPSSIEREEYLPEIQANANWLEENRFEYHDVGGYTVLRQLPGEDNALGEVKFIFPNRHNTYMHDTPKKGLFSYPIRAFSHGCMRVQEPMALAEYLLRGEGKWEGAQVEIERAKRAGKELNIPLDQALDVFIEYYTTRVDEAGRVHFLADVYKLVHDELHPASAHRRRCTPEPREQLERVDVLGDGFGP